jgi:hypothetical protein
VTVAVSGSVATKPGPLATTVVASTKPDAIGVTPSTQLTAVPVCEQVVVCAAAVVGKATTANAPHTPAAALPSSRSRTVKFFIENPLFTGAAEHDECCPMFPQREERFRVPFLSRF